MVLNFEQVILAIGEQIMKSRQKNIITVHVKNVFGEDVSVTKKSLKPVNSSNLFKHILRKIEKKKQMKELKKLNPEHEKMGIKANENGTK